MLYINTNTQLTVPSTAPGASMYHYEIPFDCETVSEFSHSEHQQMHRGQRR